MIELVAEGFNFPESPQWSERDGCLYLVDWTADRVLAWQAGRTRTLFETPGQGPSGLCQDPSGNLWLCLFSGRKLAVFTPRGEQLGAWADYQASPFRGPCDLTCDRQGGVYFTDSGDFEDDWRSGRAVGAVYHLVSISSPQPRRLAGRLHYPNGIALSLDGSQLYVNEHRKNRTLRYTIGTDGALSDRRVFYSYDADCLLDAPQAFELGPDGMCVDDQDCLFVAHYGGGKVLRISPQGELLQTIRLPRGRKPTSAAYHAAEQAIYITEAEFGLLHKIMLD
ncbi:MAG: SMP-30/gluconolactonase/LRE family protein [Chloroflexota bacterium]